MNILLSSVGRRSYLVKWFQDVLSCEGEVHASNSEFTVAMQLADKSVLTPMIYDSNYINFLVKYCKKNYINAILPLFDIDLPILANAKRIFSENGITVLVSDYNVTQICNDKWQTYNFFKKHNILTPKTFLSLDDALSAINKSEVNFPLLLKPRWGMGSIGIYSADNKLELRILYKKTIKEIFNSYLKYESNLDPSNSVLIQEQLEGQEYGLDIINDLSKNYITTFVKRKIAMRFGETYIAVTEFNPELQQLGKILSDELGHIAILDVDCFISNDQIQVLEMNCRFGGHYPFSHIAGSDIPLAIIKWLKNEIPEKKIFEIKYGIKGIIDIDIVNLRESKNR